MLKINPQNAGTKQKIFEVLSEKWPLTAKTIFEAVKKFYASELTYQAVHKTLKEMELEKMVIKKNNGYSLNVDWLQGVKKSIEQVEKRYLENNKIKIPQDFSGSIELEFDSYTDLTVSTAELILSRQLANGPEDKEMICTLEYGWWPFKFRFEHFEILAKMMFKNPDSKNIIRKKTPFGEWIRAQYKKIGAVSAPIGTKLEIDEDIFVLGNCLVEVKFDVASKKIIEHYYSKWKNVEDAFNEFGLKEEPKIHATMRITKNPEMAAFMRKQLESVFEVRGK
ncbi:MAG TPA: hypothetical protein VJI52_04865 [Candidatus Nanoarchaeia archaeon]|nr:hypothetical protein [Candidatus Nanoarchaeia archaeon]